MRLTVATGALAGVLLLAGCGGYLPDPVLTDPAESPESQTQTDAADEGGADQDSPEKDSPEENSSAGGDEGEKATGLKADIIALGWECEDVSFKDTVLDVAFNCFKDEEYIALSHFLDATEVTDYAIDVSSMSYCKVYEDAEQAYWATRDAWLLEIDEPNTTVDPLVSELGFELAQTDC